MNYLTSIIGFIAAILTTVAFVPQIIRIWRVRSAKDVSLGMYTPVSYTHLTLPTIYSV